MSRGLLALCAVSWLVLVGRVCGLCPHCSGRILSVKAPVGTSAMKAACEPVGEASTDVGRIEKLLELARKASEGRWRQRDRCVDESEQLHAVALTFEASHSRQIEFNGAFQAQKYLSLPIANYSVLDGSLVQRVECDSNAFLLTLPLGEFASSASMFGTIDRAVTPESQLVAVTTISVDADPDAGAISMSSGPVFLIDQVALSSSAAPLAAPPRSSLSQQVPAWFVWGGHQQVNTSDPTSWRVEVHSAEAARPVRSSVQPAVAIRLTWDPHQLLRSSRPARSWFRTPPPPREVERDVLVVEAIVRLRVELSLSLPKRMAASVNFFPIRALIQQAGSMFISVVMQSLAPRFEELLLQDFHSRLL